MIDVKIASLVTMQPGTIRYNIYRLTRLKNQELVWEFIDDMPIHCKAEIEASGIFISDQDFLKRGRPTGISSINRFRVFKEGDL